LRGGRGYGCREDTCSSLKYGWNMSSVDAPEAREYKEGKNNLKQGKAKEYQP
jgi:hypothetical protein